VILELDHVFLCTVAPEADEIILAEFGLRFTERRIHKGQGTANVCALFENAFLQLLYADDMKVLRSDLVKPLGLRERIRWGETNACPIGICFRVATENLAAESWPFATWEYKANFLPSGVIIPVATPRYVFNESLVFLSHQAHKPSQEKGAFPEHELVPEQRACLAEGRCGVPAATTVQHGRDGKGHRIEMDLPLKLSW
jgi:hypothetical protein